MESVRNLLTAGVMFGVPRNFPLPRIISSSWSTESSGGSLRLIDGFKYRYFLNFPFFRVLFFRGISRSRFCLDSLWFDFLSAEFCSRENV